MTPPAGTFTTITAGGYHTCGLRDDGTTTLLGRTGQRRRLPIALA